MGDVRIEASDSNRLSFLEELKNLWQNRDFCDIKFVARDGACVEAHCLVVAAASAPLKTMMQGCFLEAQTGIVEMDVSSGPLTALVQFLHLGFADVNSADLCELLRTAHQYELHELQNQVADAAAHRLDTPLALQILAECKALALETLESRSEALVARSFDEAVQHTQFMNLTAEQINRLIHHSDLVVEREELVLEAVLRWCGGAPSREMFAGLLLQGVRFPLLALSSLQKVEQYSQKAKSYGVELERAVRKGIRVHQAGGDSEEMPLAKRRCLPCWWPDLGSSVRGGITVAGGGGDRGTLHLPFALALRDGKLYVAEDGTPGRAEAARVSCWDGVAQGRLVAGRGATVNDTNEIDRLAGMAFDHEGRLLIVDGGRDRILCLNDSGIAPLPIPGVNLQEPFGIHVTNSGVKYILNEGGTAVVKVDGDSVATVAGRGHDQTVFQSLYLYATDDGDVYVSDHMNHRILHWAAGALDGVPIIGNNGAGAGLHQLNIPRGFCISAAGEFYIADARNDRIVKWVAGAPAGVVVAGAAPLAAASTTNACHRPVDVKFDDRGALLVAEITGNRVTRWGPAPSIALP